MKAIVWNGEELGAKFDELPIPDDLVEKVGRYVWFSVLQEVGWPWQGGGQEGNAGMDHPEIKYSRRFAST